MHFTWKLNVLFGSFTIALHHEESLFCTEAASEMIQSQDNSTQALGAGEHRATHINHYLEYDTQKLQNAYGTPTALERV